jgi:hypothetical protein
MGKSIVFASVALAALFSCASEFKILESDVPPVVIASFKAKYPQASATTWEAEKTEGHLAFEAEFKMNGKGMEAYFKPDGTFLKEE